MVKNGKKYDDILNSAKDLFWKYGFKRVTIEEICQEANVSKMTFYKYFPNKIELAKTIFSTVVEEGEAKFKKILKGDKPPSEKVKRILLLKLEGTNDISPEFIQDFYTGREPELQEFVAQTTRRVWESLKNDYAEAQRTGVFRKDFNPELLIKIQNKLMELMEDESFTSMFKSQQDMIMEFANLLVYGMLPHD